MPHYRLIKDRWVMRYFYISALLALIPAMGGAQESFVLEGKTFEILEGEDYIKQVKFGDKVLFEDWYVSTASLPMKIEGHEVQILSASAGGNICDAMPVMIWLEGGEPKVDASYEGCFSVDVRPKEDGIEIELPARFGYEGSVTLWRPSTGHVLKETKEFRAGLKGTWADIATSEIHTPLDAMSNAAVYDAVVAQAGDDLPILHEAISWLGDGEKRNGGFAGSSCYKFDCEEVYAYMWLDPSSEKAMLVYKGGDLTAPKSLPANLKDWAPWAAAEAKAVLASK